MDAGKYWGILNMAEQNIIKPHEQVFIVGMTGSGKSYFCETYLRGYENVIKLDTKREFEERQREGKSEWTGLKNGRDFEIVEHLDDLYHCTCNKIIYAPTFDEMDEDFYNEFFRFCFERENTIVWVDELMSVCSSSRIPPQLKRITTQGRSKGVGLFSCTQRPSGIPQIIPANSTHVICYRLRLAVDKKRMVDITGCPEFMEELGQYEFWYYRVGMKHAQRSILVEK